MTANAVHSTLQTIRALSSRALYPLRRQRYARIHGVRRFGEGAASRHLHLAVVLRRTMLSQFFDNVPGVLAFPKELKFGVGKEEALCLDQWSKRPAPEVRLSITRVNGVFRDAMHGTDDKSSGCSLRFDFDTGLFVSLFDQIWKDHPPRTGRDIAGIFFTAFFPAWLDRRISPQPSRYISGFASFVALQPGNVERFFGYYPDGYLIQVIREPVSWYRSVRAKSLRVRPAASNALKSARSVGRAIELYRQQGITLAANLREYPGRCILLDYDQLVLCEHVALRYSQIATKATFNGLQSRRIARSATYPLLRESILSAREIAQIEREAMPIYQETRRLTMPVQPVANR